MKRVDLLALSRDALVALANRGLVKRAERALSSDALPSLEVEADGTVVASFDDGVTTRLEHDVPLAEAPCSCGAHAMCRHRVLSVMMYQRAHGAGEGDDDAATASPWERWSPGEFDDEALAARIGERALRRARALRSKGYVAVVRRPTEDDPTPTVELATCTVRFLVPHELSHTQTDAREHDELVFLACAVWAFRRADELTPSGDRVDVEINALANDEVTDALASTLALAAELLLEGVVHTRGSRAAQAARARRDLEAARLVWPGLALRDLEEQLVAYRERRANHDPEELADLLLELFARERAARLGTAMPARRVLGQDEALTTELKHLGLLSLGARLSGTDNARRADVLFVDSKTGTPLVLRKDWLFAEDEEVPDVTVLARRQLAAGATLAALAVGRVITTSAKRQPNRLLTLGRGRVAKTQVMPSQGRWDELPDSLKVTSVAQLRQELGARPPRLLRPRVLADGLRVFVIGEVHAVIYTPATQTLTATLSDPEGAYFTVELAHRVAAPGALDLLAKALSGELGAPRYLSGIARLGARGVVVSPLTVLADEAQVLDLAPADTRHAMGRPAPSPPGDATDEALLAASSLLVEGAHRGLRHARASYDERLARSAAKLVELGLVTTGARVRELVGALDRARRDSTAEGVAVTRWVEALMRVRLCEEGRSRSSPAAL